MENPVEDNEIELYDYLKILYKYKYFIVFVAFVSVVLSVAIVNRQKPVIRESNIKLKLFFNGIQNGHYPDKTNFNKNDIVNPRFLVDTVNSIDVKQYNLEKKELILKLRPFVREIIPGEVIEKRDTLKKSKSLEKFEFSPDEFEIYLREPEGMDVPNSIREEILDGIAANWMKWFKSSFIESQLLANVLDKIDFSEYEYFNILDLIEANVKNALSNIEKIPSDLRNFRSLKVGFNPADLKMMLDVFLINDLFRLRSVIDVENIHKDRKMALKYLEYKVKSLKKLRDKANAKYEFVSSMMVRVENSTPSPLPTLFALMFNKNIENVPGMQKTESPEISSVPDIFQKLAMQATETGMEKTDLDEDIKFLQRKIDNFKSMGHKYPEETIGIIDNKIKQLSAKSADIIEMFNTLRLELNEQKLNNSIKVMSNPKSYTLSRGLKKIGMISFVAGLFGAVFLAFFINYVRERLMVSNDRVIR